MPCHQKSSVSRTNFSYPRDKHKVTRHRKAQDAKRPYTAMDNPTMDAGPVDPKSPELSPAITPGKSRAARHIGGRPPTPPDTRLVDSSRSTPGSASTDLERLAINLGIFTKRKGTKLRVKAMSERLNNLLKSPRSTESPSTRERHSGSYLLTTMEIATLPTPSPAGVSSTSGEERGGEESPDSSWSESHTSSSPPRQVTGTKHGTTALDGPDPETEDLIQELMKVAHIKSTNKRIKIIATQIRNALLNNQRPFRRTAFRPEMEEVLRYHESIMAELMQELDNLQKPSTGTSDLVTIRGITRNLVDHWGAVKTAMHGISPQPSPGPGSETSISPPPSPPQTSANVPRSHSPRIKSANDISSPPHLTIIKNKLAEQDHKIDEILSLLQNSD